jgi:hypothetical protein
MALANPGSPRLHPWYSCRMPTGEARTPSFAGWALAGACVSLRGVLRTVTCSWVMRVSPLPYVRMLISAAHNGIPVRMLNWGGVHGGNMGGSGRGVFAWPWAACLSLVQVVQ